MSNQQQKGIFKEDRNLSPIKDKIRATSLSSKESGINLIPINNNNFSYNYNNNNNKARNQFVLNSLKVLRVSQNFLPPLLHAKEYNRVNSE